MVTDLNELEDTQTIEWLVVGVHREENAMYDLLLEYAEAVHIHGEPCKWFIERILKRTPNLKQIRVIPAYASMVDLESEAGKLLAEHNIEVIVGRIGDKRKDRSDFTTTSYRDKRYFMLRLDDEQKKMLPELEKHAPEDWAMASRYLCLDGQKHLTLEELAGQHNLSTNHVQDMVGTVLYYLDSPFNVSLAALRRARVLQERIEKGREEDRLTALRLKKLKTLNLSLEDLPQGMSDDYLEDYALIRNGWLRCKLEEYLLTPRDREFLARRYGLRDKQFRTLEEIGQEFGLTRERVRQVEQKAIKKLRTFAVLLSPSS